MPKANIIRPPWGIAPISALCLIKPTFTVLWLIRWSRSRLHGFPRASGVIIPHSLSGEEQKVTTTTLSGFTVGV